MGEKYSGFREHIDRLLADVGTFLGDLVEAPRGEHADSHIQIDEHLQQFWNVYYNLKTRHDDAALSVAVLALTKSGKSTLLNAFLGAECLPVNNVPETARICKIIHTPSAAGQPVMEEGDLVHNGEAAIRQRLQEINHDIRAREHQLSDEKILIIKAPFSALQTVSGSSDNTRLYLLDTPGPNEAGEEGLRYQVERMLDSVDAVIYLLDYTKLKTAEEAQVLDRLKLSNPQLVRRLSQRLFFVVNKADQLQQSEGLDEEETREYVADLITRQLACDGFHLTSEQVMLLSARDALLSRLVLSGRASESAQRMFLRNSFGRRCNVPRPMEEVAAAAVDMLEGSGLPELESRVLSFLYTHGGGVKLLATVDDISRLLREVENVAVTSVAALKGSVEGLTAEAEGLRADLQEALNHLDTVLDKTTSLHGQITNEIREHLEGLRSRLFTYIMEALNTEGITTPAATATGSSASSSSSASSAPTIVPRRWSSVRQRFAALFSGTNMRTGVPRTPNREQLLGSLSELHDDVMAQINSEVRDFWGVLEQVCNARNTALIHTINTHLQQLAVRIEEAVEQRLEVRLQPAKLHLPLPDAHQFHSDLQDLIARGVEERQERHVRVGQRQFQQRELRGGICRWGSYWVPTPMTRTFVESYTSTVYQLQPNEVMRHFIELVDGAVESSEGVLAAYVEHYFQNQVAQARSKIQEYGERYVGVVTAALEASYEGSESREGALCQVEAHLQQARALADTAARLQGAIEEAVPSAGGCNGFDEVDGESYVLDFEDHTNPLHLPRAALEAPEISHDNPLLTLQNPTNPQTVPPSALIDLTPVTITPTDPLPPPPQYTPFTVAATPPSMSPPTSPTANHPPQPDLINLTEITEITAITHQPDLIDLTADTDDEAAGDLSQVDATRASGASSMISSTNSTATNYSRSLPSAPGSASLDSRPPSSLSLASAASSEEAFLMVPQQQQQQQGDEAAAAMAAAPAQAALQQQLLGDEAAAAVAAAPAQAALQQQQQQEEEETAAAAAAVPSGPSAVAAAAAADVAALSSLQAPVEVAAAALQLQAQPQARHLGASQMTSDQGGVPVLQGTDIGLFADQAAAAAAEQLPTPTSSNNDNDSSTNTNTSSSSGIGSVVFHEATDSMLSPSSTFSDHLDATIVIEHIDVPPFYAPSSLSTSEPTTPSADSPHPISPPVCVLYTDVINPESLSLHLHSPELNSLNLEALERDSAAAAAAVEPQSQAQGPQAVVVAVPTGDAPPGVNTPLPAAKAPPATGTPALASPFAVRSLQMLSLSAMQPGGVVTSSEPQAPAGTHAAHTHADADAASAMAAAMGASLTATAAPAFISGAFDSAPVSATVNETVNAVVNATVNAGVAEQTEVEAGVSPADAVGTESAEEDAEGDAEGDVDDYTKICVLAEDIPDAPFDYQKGFAEAMSSGALEAMSQADVEGDGASSDGSEDWMMVEGEEHVGGGSRK